MKPGRMRILVLRADLAKAAGPIRFNTAQRLIVELAANVRYSLSLRVAVRSMCCARRQGAISRHEMDLHHL